jgi:hypothetical protein
MGSHKRLTFETNEKVNAAFLEEVYVSPGGSGAFFWKANVLELF